MTAGFKKFRRFVGYKKGSDDMAFGDEVDIEAFEALGLKITVQPKKPENEPLECSELPVLSIPPSRTQM